MNFPTLPRPGPDDGRETKINEKTVVSLHVVVLIIMLVIWLARVGFHVEVQDHQLKSLEKELGRCFPKASKSKKIELPEEPDDGSE